jgi:hypothetical protein
MTITSETAQSGMVSHEVERDGEDVEIITRKLDTVVRFAVNVTPAHARELAMALMEVAGNEPWNTPDKCEHGKKASVPCSYDGTGDDRPTWICDFLGIAEPRPLIGQTILPCVACAEFRSRK